MQILQQMASPRGSRGSPRSPLQRLRQPVLDDGLQPGLCRGIDAKAEVRCDPVPETRLHPSQSWPYQHRPEPRHEQIRVRQFSLVLEAYRPAMLPARQIHSLVVRLWRKQFGGTVSFQTGLATPRQRPGNRNPSGSLPKLLLEVQPNRTSLLSSCRSCLPRNAIRHPRHRGPPNA